MSESKGFREIAYVDCPGGGQVVVEGGFAFLGHMAPPAGTSIIDVRDPASPRVVARLEMPPNTHSHKVRVGNGLMITNRERLGGQQPAGFMGGLAFHDISDPANPRPIGLWETAGRGVHRFDFDGRYAYISPTVEGYLGNIVMILDLADPQRPEEVGRWWIPGQWQAGGEEADWGGRMPRCHHPLRLGDRLYTSYWHAGFVILDIADMSAPKFVSGLDWSPPFPWPTHTTLPLPFPVQGRRLMLVADEDVAQLYPSPPAFLWLVDITDETRPMPFASFQVAGVDGSPQPPMTGCHQPCEKVTGTEIPVAWFAHGLRVVDVANPHAPREVACFLPDPPPGQARVQSNDVTVDDDGLVYLLDRVRGLHILERI
jgi:hypothetical protein